MRAARLALRERRNAADALAAACVAFVAPPSVVPMKLAYHLDPNIPDEQTALLIKLG